MHYLRAGDLLELKFPWVEISFFIDEGEKIETQRDQVTLHMAPALSQGWDQNTDFVIWDPRPFPLNLNKS